MKKYILFLMSCIALTSFAQNYPSGKYILDKVDNNMSAKSRVLTARMEINSARGTRTMKSKSWGVGTEKSFTEYLAPGA